MDTTGANFVCETLFDKTFKLKIVEFLEFSSPEPLKADEVIDCLRRRWGVTYHLRILVRSNRMYIQMMWGYLEQQSFPLDESSYRIDLNNTLEIVNRVGQANLLRNWLRTVEGKPRLGVALTLPLMKDQRLGEYLVGD